MYQRSAAEKPRKDSAPFELLEGESFCIGTFGRLWNGPRSVPACRRNCSSNTKKTEPIFSTHTIFLIKNQITTQRPHNKKFLTILKTMHCKMPQVLMVPLSSDNVHLVLNTLVHFLVQTPCGRWFSQQQQSQSQTNKPRRKTVL